MRALRVPVALLLGGAGVAGALSAPVLAGGSRGRLDEASIILVITTYVVVALVIELARPGQPVGRVMLLGACGWGLGEGLLAAGIAGVTDQSASASYAALGVAGTALRGLGWLLLIVVVPLIFPEGRAPWRWASRLAGTCLVAFTAASLVTPEPLEERLDGVANPVGLPGSLQPVTDVVALSAIALAFGCLVVAVAGQVRRWRGGDDLMRQQVTLFALAFAPPLLVLPVVATPVAEPWMFAVACLPVPLAVGASLLQRRLYDIQLAASRTVAYLALSFALAAVYALVVGGIGVMFEDRGAAWLPWAAAGVVAVAFAPLRDGLQRAANRVVYGRWSAPAEVLADTGRRLADAADGRSLLASLVDELVHGLGLTYAEICDVTGRSLARSGVAHDHPQHLELSAYGVGVGSLRWAGPSLREADLRLLRDLSHQVGGVVHASGLVDQVRAAQERLVLAREQERRRLRRDLHDGLGPSLAGLGLQVDTVRNLLDVGAPIDGRLETLRSGLQDTVTEVRRIVEGLRPAAIDELGLFGAVEQLSHALAGGAGLRLTLQLPEDRPILPAAVEVVAYRVTQEALTNVVRHSEASSCEVIGSVSSDCLSLRIRDDGLGGAGAVPGVGLGSMRERAGEIGGRVDVLAAGPGTTVMLRLPLRAGATQ